MIILTDVDGVLLSWAHSFEWWMKRKGYKKGKCISYKVSEMYGLSVDEADVLVRHFNESAAIGFLPPLNDAIKYVRKMHEEHGAVFHAITSLGTEPYAQRLREENLKRVFGDGIFERVQCIDCGADKTEALKRYEDSGFVWLEDKPENAEVGAKLGLRSFLFNQPYNTDYEVSEDVIRVKNWKDLYDYIY
jgi:hypothetical protein